MYATSMKDRLLAAAKAKAKELQQDAADTIEKIDKGIKGDDKGIKGDDRDIKGDDNSPTKQQGDERAAS